MITLEIFTKFLALYAFKIKENKYTIEFNEGVEEQIKNKAVSFYSLMIMVFLVMNNKTLANNFKDNQDKLIKILLTKYKKEINEMYTICLNTEYKEMNKVLYEYFVCAPIDENRT